MRDFLIWHFPSQFILDFVRFQVSLVSWVVSQGTASLSQRPLSSAHRHLGVYLPQEDHVEYIAC